LPVETILVEWAMFINAVDIYLTIYGLQRWKGHTKLADIISYQNSTRHPYFAASINTVDIYKTLSDVISEL
jgi:hypothetical protein